MSALTLAAWRPATRSKYVAVGLVALRQRLSERSILIARASFHVLVLVIFARLWAAVLDDARQHIWYLAVAEWVLLSQPRLFAEIERDVRSGDVACALARPTSYLWVKLTEGAAEMLLAMLVLGLTGGAAAFVLAGGWPVDPVGLLAAVLLGLLGGTFWLLCSAAIGLCAFWLQDCLPLYWIWQKAAFLLGGLFLPLELYPGWLRTLALATPFSAMVNGPARMVFGLDPVLATLLAVKLLASIVIAWLVLDVIHERALRTLSLNGG
jgi:ABC-2 type transport system permease protein